MIIIDKTTNIGKIYQVYINVNLPVSDKYTIIQTFGPPISNSICCASSSKLREILFSLSNSKIIINTISSFFITEEINSWLRISLCRGNDIYLYTLENFKVWYADVLLHEFS